MKHYLNDLLTTCAPDNGFVQDAIEYALLHNWVHATGEDFDLDVRTIMLCYDEIIERYRPIHQRLTQELTASYAPLFAHIPLDCAA